MAAAEQPLGPRRLDFGVLTDDDFELLCYLVALLEFPEAVRLRALERGADSALPGTATRAYTRYFQAKRFTGHVQWRQCLDSLDAAVGAYQMPHGLSQREHRFFLDARDPLGTGSSCAELT